VVLQIYQYKISPNYSIPSSFSEFLEAPVQTTPHMKQMDYVAERLHSSEHLSFCQIKGIPAKGIC